MGVIQKLSGNDRGSRSDVKAPLRVPPTKIGLAQLANGVCYGAGFYA